MKTVIAALAAWLAVAGCANAAETTDQYLGTLNTMSVPYMSQGKLGGCQITFDAMIQDFTYRNGGFLQVSGGVAVMAIGDPPKLGTTVKIVANGITIDKDGKAVTTPATPTRAYLVDDTFNSNLESFVTGTPSDNTGGYYAIYQLNPTFKMVLDGLLAKKLTIMFNENGGNTDVAMHLELDVLSSGADGSRKRGSETIDKFGQCLKTLSSRLK
jgi:hypothetical protein